MPKISAAQQRLLDRVQEDGSVQVTAKFFRTVDALEKRGLVNVQRGDMYPASIKFRGAFTDSTYKAVWTVTPKES